MKKKFNMIKQLLSYLSVITLFAACGGGSDTSTGTLGIGLTDAPGDYLHVFVTIDEVQVKKSRDGAESNWIKILNPTPQKTFDLLELQNGVVTDLGIAELAVGQYNQMRLILGSEPDNLAAHPFANYLVVDGEEGKGPEVLELKVPSGLQTGIKITHEIDIVADGATEITLDFDANKSVVQAGRSGNWLLKPNIKVLETLKNSVSGNVDPAGSHVSAQLYEESADIIAQVKIQGGTTSDGNGDYKIYLAPNTYNIVATMTGFIPECQTVEATPGYQDYPVDGFVLTSAGEGIGAFTGSVLGVAIADFSIRQLIDCGSGEVVIEVASVGVADGATSEEIAMPAGNYEIVVSAAGEETYVENITLTTGESINVVYPPTL